MIRYQKRQSSLLITKLSRCVNFSTNLVTTMKYYLMASSWWIMSLISPAFASSTSCCRIFVDFIFLAFVIELSALLNLPILWKIAAILPRTSCVSLLITFRLASWIIRASLYIPTLQY